MTPPPATSGPARGAPCSGRRIASAGLVVGLIVLVAGLFAGWLASGDSVRNSYQLAGVADRLLRLSAGWRTVLSSWPAIAPLAALAVVLLVLRRPVVAAVVAGGLAGAVGWAAVRWWQLRLPPSLPGVAVEDTGPLITTVGAGLTVVAAIGVAVGVAGAAMARRPRPWPDGQGDPEVPIMDNPGRRDPGPASVAGTHGRRGVDTPAPAAPESGGTFHD